MLAWAKGSSSQEHASGPCGPVASGFGICCGRAEEKLPHADMRKEECAERHPERVLRHQYWRATISPRGRPNR